MPTHSVIREEVVNVRRDGTVLVANPHPSGETEIAPASVPSYAQMRVSHVQTDGLVTANVEPLVSHAPTPPAGGDRQVEG